MELINLRNHSLKYHSHQEIEKILTWNIVKKFLEKNQKNHLFSYISDIVITEKNISIYVTKPIVKSELNILKESLSDAIVSGLSEQYNSHKRAVKII